MNVIVVEDIYDTGHSMNSILEHIRSCEPKSVKTCIMLRKMNEVNLQHNFEIDFQGFYIPDHFVIGCGLDYNEHFRDLPYVAIFNQQYQLQQN